MILEHALAAGGVQGVELPVEDLAAFGGGDAGVADEAHGRGHQKVCSYNYGKDEERPLHNTVVIL